MKTWKLKHFDNLSRRDPKMLTILIIHQGRPKNWSILINYLGETQKLKHFDNSSWGKFINRSNLIDYYWGGNKKLKHSDNSSWRDPKKGAFWEFIMRRPKTEASYFILITHKGETQKLKHFNNVEWGDLKTEAF